MIVWVQNYDFSFKITKETRFYCFSLLKKDTNSCNILQILAQYLQKCYFGGNTLDYSLSYFRSSLGDKGDACHKQELKTTPRLNLRPSPVMREDKTNGNRIARLSVIANI